MNTPTSRNPMLFCDYYKQWINVYKEGAIRPVTMSKYNMAHQWLLKLAPDLSISELDRISYQKILNEYAEEHEHQTTMDFHHHVKCAILDAVDKGLIPRDPTRKAIIKGKKPREKKQKFLNQFELHKLIEDLDLGPVDLSASCTQTCSLPYCKWSRCNCPVHWCTFRLDYHPYPSFHNRWCGG